MNVRDKLNSESGNARNNNKVAVRVYMDYAASTQPREEVIETMCKSLRGSFGNPNSLHKEGRAARKALEDARLAVASEIGASAQEIVFAGSGTEANNLAIQGALKSAKRHLKPKHAITLGIEHSSVLEVLRALESEGVNVSYCGVSDEGVINMDEFRSLLSEETALVSVMLANNEIGTIEPLAEIAREIKRFKQSKKSKSMFPLLHTDAAQAPLYLNVDVGKLGIDLLTLDAQKIYGPKGVGALFVRKGVEIGPVIFGGGQESGLRSGTQNVAGILGFAKALEVAGREREKETSRLRELQKYFFEQIQEEVPIAKINGSVKPEVRLPNNVNISILGVEGDYLTTFLDKKGIAASSASACLSDGVDGSHVIRALGHGEERSRSALRFSMGEGTTKKDIDVVISALREVVKTLGLSS